MNKPNLPEKKITKAVVSSIISDKIFNRLYELEIQPLKLYGAMNCDMAVKHHPDLYLINSGESLYLFAKNICSVTGDFQSEIIEVEYPKGNFIKYPGDVLLNAVFLGDKLICCKKHIHKDILEYAQQNDINIINVNQGYTKCNICAVDEKSVITEDSGIAKTLIENNFNVLLLEKHFVKLPDYKYGFIGGASGKISLDKLAFYGNIEKHPEYNRIYDFLYKRDVEAVSLSDEPLMDYGSLIPIL